MEGGVRPGEVVESGGGFLAVVLAVVLLGVALCVGSGDDDRGPGPSPSVDDGYGWPR